MSAIRSKVAPRRVGHKGAAHLAPGNTLASFEAAVRAGVDMIEFDVLSERPDGSGRLLLAHDYGALAARARRSRSSRASSTSPASAYAGIELDVDVKLPGYGARVVRALREAGLIERALVSSTYPEDLDAMRAIEPTLRVGWSVPRARRDYTESRLTVAPGAGAARRLPRAGCRAARAPVCAAGASTRSWRTGAWSRARSCAPSPRAAASCTCGPSTTPR